MISILQFLIQWSYLPVYNCLPIYCRTTTHRPHIPAIYNTNCKQSLVIKFDVFILGNNFSGIVYCILRFYSYCLVCRKYPVKKSILQQLVFYSTASWVEGCGLRWSFPSLELSRNMLPMEKILNTYRYLPYFWYKNKSAQSAFPINFLLPPAYFTLQDDEM